MQSLMKDVVNKLCNKLTVSAVKPALMPVWKMVKLGTCKTPEAYRKAFDKAGIRIADGGWGDDILDRITCSKEKINLELVVLSVGDLGFKDSASYADICAKAQELGLELCPAEVGPALHLQYGDQPNRKLILIAMEAITGRCGRPLIFYVERNYGCLWLDGFLGDPGVIWRTEYRFVFSRRKK